MNLWGSVVLFGMVMLCDIGGLSIDVDFIEVGGVVLFGGGLCRWRVYTGGDVVLCGEVTEGMMHIKVGEWDCKFYDGVTFCCFGDIAAFDYSTKLLRLMEYYCCVHCVGVMLHCGVKRC